MRLQSKRGAQAAATRAGSHRGDRRSQRALAQALGATLRAGRRRAELDQPAHRESVCLWVAQDLSDPTRYSPFLLQGGLVMPDRDFYLNPSQKMADIRRQYQAHIAKVLTLAQLPEVRAARHLRTRAAHRPGALEPPGYRAGPEGQQSLDAPTRAARTWP
jgi:hypothetical protein